jgi:integrase
VDPATVWLHKWRATAATNWLRSRELGGRGWDIAVVRQHLGHNDYKSIEAYIAIVRNEELALQEYAAQMAASGKRDPSLDCRENGLANRGPAIVSGMGEGAATAD